MPEAIQRSSSHRRMGGVVERNLQFHERILALEKSAEARGSTKASFWKSIGLLKTNWQNWKKDPTGKAKVGQIAVICQKLNCDPRELRLSDRDCDKVRDYLSAEFDGWKPAGTSRIAEWLGIEKIVEPVGLIGAIEVKHETSPVVGSQNTVSEILVEVLGLATSPLTWVKLYHPDFQLLYGGDVATSLLDEPLKAAIKNGVFNPHEWERADRNYFPIENCPKWLNSVSQKWDSRCWHRNAEYIWATKGVQSEVYVKLLKRRGPLGLVNCHYHDLTSEKNLEELAHRQLDLFASSSVSQRLVNAYVQELQAACAELSSRDASSARDNLRGIISEAAQAPFVPRRRPSRVSIESNVLALERETTTSLTFRRVDQPLRSGVRVPKRHRDSVSTIKDTIDAGVVCPQAFNDTLAIITDFFSTIGAVDISFGQVLGTALVHITFTPSAMSGKEKSQETMRAQFDPYHSRLIELQRGSSIFAREFCWHELPLAFVFGWIFAKLSCGQIQHFQCEQGIGIRMFLPDADLLPPGVSRKKPK